MAENTTIVYTTGVFDMLHPGHLVILRRARALGDKLVVGVQEDASVEAQKGSRPIMSTRERITMLRALPFVDLVIPYGNIDQRPMLKTVKPHIMVQGGDWHTTSDRSKIVEYAKKRGIRIVVLPYTRGISSTAIKERVFNSLSDARREKQLEYDLAERLTLVPLKSLYTYEANDPERTRRLVGRIRASGVLLDPVTVGDIGKGRSLVVDGANRVEALRQLGSKYVPVQSVAYLDSREVQLRGNEHYLDVKPNRFFSFVRAAGISMSARQSNGKGQTFDAATLALVYADGAVYSLGASDNWRQDIVTLNAFVRSYKGQVMVRRKSEVGNLIGNASVLVKFRAFTPSDIVVLVSRRMRLESGITWHIPESAVTRFEVPFAALKRGFPSRQKAASYIQNLIHERQKNNTIRRYLSNVYMCNEWE